MWLSFAEKQEFPSVYLFQESNGPHTSLVPEYENQTDLHKQLDLLSLDFYNRFKEHTIQSFIQSISEPVALQTSFHQYLITPYSMLGGASTGFSLPDVFFGFALIAWHASCRYLPRSFEFSAIVEVVCVLSFVTTLIERWQANIHTDPRALFSQTNFYSIIKKLEIRASHEEMKFVVSCISSSLRNLFFTTCLDRVLRFIFVTFERYGKISLIRKTMPGAEEEYFLESIASDITNTKIMKKFGLATPIVPDIPIDEPVTKKLICVPRDVLIDVKAYIIDELQYSITEHYAFSLEHTEGIPLKLQDSVDPRPYQQEAWQKFASSGSAISGLVVLPCGAGKSLVGIGAICQVSRPAIVVCPSSVSVEQWRDQFLQYTTPKNPNLSIDDLIYRCTSKSKDRFRESTCIVLTTYAMLTVNRSSEQLSKKNPIAWVTARRFGLLVFDEVHQLPAQTFQKCIRRIPAKCVLGLTATLLREDNKCKALTSLIGPKLFEATWWDLHQENYISQAVCRTILCETHQSFIREYSRPDTPAAMRIALAAANPVKTQACVRLARHHLQRGDKVLVFSDSLHALKIAQTYLHAPMIIGTTSHDERMRILFEFQFSQSCGIVLLSRVGDTSINLPAASVLIQISSQGGSRRQEMQRIGRLLRPKEDGTRVQFYSLVSRWTHEEKFASKRGNFLVQQGYSCKLESTNESSDPELPFSTEKDVLDMLARLITKWRVISLEEFLERKQLLDDVPEEDNFDEDWLGACVDGISVRRGQLRDISTDSDLIFSEYQVT